MLNGKNRRVLVIDDNPSIHDDFQKILASRAPADPSMSAKEALLFGLPPLTESVQGFEIDSAYQGDQGVEMIHRACQADKPYALAFVDVRMPPGIDGIETIEQLWRIDSAIQCVICSAHSDYSAADILGKLGVSDRLLMLRKPCDPAEILLIASSLCEKWNLAHAAVQPVPLQQDAPFCAPATIGESS